MSKQVRHSGFHYDDVIMTMLASQITSLTVVYSIVYSGVNQRKHQSSASLAFVREIHRGPMNFPHKWPVTRKMFPFDDVIMFISIFRELFIMRVAEACQPTTGYPHCPGQRLKRLGWVIMCKWADAFVLLTCETGILPSVDIFIGRVFPIYIWSVTSYPSVAANDTADQTILT